MMSVSAAKRWLNNQWDCKSEDGVGAIFRREWALARARDVRVVLVSVWNFWSTSEERSADCSFTIEPQVPQPGGYGFTYLDMLAEEAAKFKARLP